MMEDDDEVECLNAFVPYSLLDGVCKKIEENNHEKNFKLISVVYLNKGWLRQIEDEDMVLLYEVFGKNLEQSLEMIEGECFELVTIANTERNYMVVHGPSCIYTLYPYVNFCQCFTYKANICKGKNFVCKHILGSRLALSMKKYKERISEDFIYHNMSDISVL